MLRIAVQSNGGYPLDMHGLFAQSLSKFALYNTKKSGYYTLILAPVQVFIILCFLLFQLQY